MAPDDVTSEVGDEPNEPGKVEEPAEATEPAKDEGERRRKKPEDRKVTAEAGEPNEPNEPRGPNEPMENLNLKDVEVKDIIKTLAEWTGKVIIPVDDAMKKKITIYSQEKLPRSHALALIYSALREQGIVAEEKDGAIVLRPIEDVKLRSVPTVPDNVPLASLKNKAEVVQKFFKLRNYSPTQLEKVIQPLMPEYGYVSAIENTSHIVVIDTVGNLERVERIIKQLDVPETKETVTRTFEIQAGDPVEIVQLLNILVGQGELSKPSPPQRRSSRPERRSSRPERSDRSKKAESKPASSVVLGRTDTPITLIPLPKRRWIIAKASAEDMVEIEAWIAELDEKKPDEREHKMVKVKFADVQEVADQINNMIATMPLRANVTVQALRRAKQVMIVGSAENREMVRQLVAEIDVPTDQFITVHIPLEYADPEQIKKNLDELYTQFSYYESRSRYGGSYSSRYYRGRETSDPDFVRVIAYPTLKQITVIASAENMVKIEEQVKEWDKPIDIGEIGPVIIELKNSDPVKMVDLLTRLFTETERRWSWRDYIYGTGSVNKTMVGPLYGQLAFEAVPDTRKIIVQSKVPEGYAVVRKLIRELDSEEMAEVPTVITLKYADPEDLSERLNAMFNEPGTTAPIRRIRRGLSEYSMNEGEDGTRRESGDGGGTGSTSEYRTWWGQGFQRRMDEMPISNVIGRIRFIPDPRSKSILVLSPPEYISSVEAMIRELDIPGRQVRVKAAILLIDNRDMTSLGIQLATNPAAFGTLDENAIAALATLSTLDERGSLTISGTMNITALLDFLVKSVDARILNQQTLWTKDNEEADFFRGDIIAFTKDFSVSETGGRTTQGFEFEQVGMTLRVRPSITPEKHVDMRINMMLSKLTSDIVNEQPVRTEMDTETSMIVQNGETIMLGGMLFQEDSTIERKIPLFGDLPLLGGLFRHYEVVKANSEVLVFVTPDVIDEDPSEMRAETTATIEAEKARLKEVLAELEGKVKDAG
jgi:general secretion pathway protein D